MDRKGLLSSLRQCLIYSLIVLAIDLAASVLAYLIVPLEIASFLSLLLLVESGVGLALGGALDLVSSASVSKALEQTSGSEHKEPWTMRKYEIGHKTINKILITSGIIFVAGLVVSLCA